MSFSNSLLKRLKGCFQKLMTDTPIMDSTNSLNEFCASIEDIFHNGLCPRDFGVETSPWPWLFAISTAMEAGTLPKTFAYIRSCEFVLHCKKCVTNTGRLRLLIRVCLVNKCLHIPIEIMVRDLPKSQVHNWYKGDSLSILGDDIFGEIFLSVILQAGHLDFRLCLNNSRLLDRTWSLPQIQAVEFVPCQTLGLSIMFVSGLAVVIGIGKGSVAAEDNLIDLGDVIDEVNGHVLTDELRGKVKKVLEKNVPIKVTVMKTFCSDPEKMLPELRLIIANSKQLANLLQKSLDDSLSSQSPSTLTKGADEHIVLVDYIGCTEVGASGDIYSIENAIESVIKNNELINTPNIVGLDCRELEIIIFKYHKAKNCVFMRHPYVRISSCAQSRKLSSANKYYFGYMLGNESCMVANSYTCHVYRSQTESDALKIMRNIGHGFERTECVV